MLNELERNHKEYESQKENIENKDRGRRKTSRLREGMHQENKDKRMQKKETVKI